MCFILWMKMKMGLSSSFLIFILLEALLLCISMSEVHNYNFELKEANFTRLCRTKSILTVNGMFPGPEIRVRKGDTVLVRVQNSGLYGITIHWHGVKQPRNPWGDGPEYITQCPIQPGGSFLYKVLLTTEEGTLWWHAHSDWSRATVYGALVILPPPGCRYPFRKPTGEQTLILGSWYHGDLMQGIKDIPIGGDPPLADAMTINGQPGDFFKCSCESTFRMNVDSGQTYLLRIINNVMNEENFFAIGNHTLTVVAQDAAYVKPFQTNYLMITPGQTFDVLVTANQPPSEYYIATSAYADFPFVTYDESTATAVFQYSGRYKRPNCPYFPYQLPEPNSTRAAKKFTNQIKNLKPLITPLGKPSKHIFMTVSLNNVLCDNPTGCLSDDNGVTRLTAALNNVTFVTPNVSVLEAYYRNMNQGVYTEDFPTKPPQYYDFTGTGAGRRSNLGTKVMMINYGESVEIVFQGTNVGIAMNHPMHLHGYSFYLVGTGFGNFNNVTDPKKYNLVDPPEINTVGVPTKGWATVRFIADNPGVWFMHCHLERHASWGMDTVLIVRNGPTQETSIRPEPKGIMPLCAHTLTSPTSLPSGPLKVEGF